MSERGSKHVLLEHLLAQGAIMFVCDARRCLVPEHLRARPDLRLIVGRPPAVDITDLTITEEELSATMTFVALGDDSQYHCVIPLTAIYAASLIGAGGAPTCSITWWVDAPRDLAEAAAALQTPPTSDAGN